MSPLLLVLALQAQEPPPVERPSPAQDDSFTRKGHFEIGPIAQYWLPRFKGHAAADGATKIGTTLDFVDDLGLPDDAAIPMLGGGAFGAWVRNSIADSAELLFVAEYWGHSWAGHSILPTTTNFGDDTFPAGSSVENRFHLSSLTLDASIAVTKGIFTFGGALSIQVQSGRLFMDSAAIHSSQTFRDFCWGGGALFEVHPIPFLLAGLSLKGFTSFGDGQETGVGDFRFYAAVKWNALSLEGGYRVMLYDLDLPNKSLSYTMYGPYVALNAIVRF